MPNPRDEEKPNNTVGNILNKKTEREKNDEIIKERLEQYTKALNAIAATPNGKEFFSIFIKICGVFSPEDSNDPTVLLRNGERKNMYLNYIRPYLELEIKKDLENV